MWLWTLWAKDWSQLIELLRRQTNACLSIAHRQRFLAEPAEQARQRYEACEASYGRAGANGRILVRTMA